MMHLADILLVPGAFQHPLYGLDFGPRAAAGSSATAPETAIVQTHHKKLAQKYEANSASVGDNIFITGRRGLLPPS